MAGSARSGGRAAGRGRREVARTAWPEPRRASTISPPTRPSPPITRASYRVSPVGMANSEWRIANGEWRIERNPHPEEAAQRPSRRMEANASVAILRDAGLRPAPQDEGRCSNSPLATCNSSADRSPGLVSRQVQALHHLDVEVARIVQ